MRATFLVFKPGTADPEVQEIDGAPTLDILKAGIGGGYLEAVPYFNRIHHAGQWRNCVVFCDENGKVHHQPPNERATELWDRTLIATKGITASPDFLVGQILVVIGDHEFMEAL